MSQHGVHRQLLALRSFRLQCMQTHRYSTSSTSSSSNEVPDNTSTDATPTEDADQDSAQASTSSVVYTRPQDAYDPLFANLDQASFKSPGSTSSHRGHSSSSSVDAQKDARAPPAPSTFNRRPPPLSPFTAPGGSHSTSPTSLSNKSSLRSAPRQRQTLTNAEAQTFADLLEQLLPPQGTGMSASRNNAAADPTGSSGSGLFAAIDRATQQASTSSHGSSPTPAAAPGTELVQAALRRKVNQRLGLGDRETSRNRTRSTSRKELSPRENDELDRMREVMISFSTDLELLEWSMHHVFGFEMPAGSNSIFPDSATVNAASASALPTEALSATDSTSSLLDEAPIPAGPASPIYPDLLLILFLLLRDAHNRPHAALHVFKLASSAPRSYVAGCSTALYNEVLRTRWLVASGGSGGDVETVAEGLNEMRAAGVRMDERTREIVAAVGEAIRIDGERAERRVKARSRARAQIGQGASSEQGPSGVSLSEQINVEEQAQALLSSQRRSDAGPLTEREADLDDEAAQERALARARYFSRAQIIAWAQMERIVEENLEEQIQARWTAREAQREDEWTMERTEAERDRPSLFFGDAPKAGAGRSMTPTTTMRKRDSNGWDRWDKQEDSHDFRPRLDARADGFDDLPFSNADYRSASSAAAMSAPTKRPSFANPYKIRRQALTKSEKSRRDKAHPMLFWKKPAA